MGFTKKISLSDRLLSKAHLLRCSLHPLLQRTVSVRLSRVFASALNLGPWATAWRKWVRQRTAETANQKTFVALIAHGSRDPRWCSSLKMFFDEEGKKKNGMKNFGLCFMGLMSPSLLELVSHSSPEKLTHVEIFPLFLSNGGHVDREIPEQVGLLRERYPHLSVRVLDSMGEQKKIQKTILEMIKTSFTQE